MLIELVDSSARNEQDLLTLLKQFDPLLKKYGRQLGTEDGYKDMRLEFIEFIRSFNKKEHPYLQDGAMVNYIAVSMKNRYRKLLRQKIKNNFHTVPWDSVSSVNCNDNNICYNRCSLIPILDSKVLTKKEIAVLILCYEHGWTSAEIARKMNVSRQNVNQIKRNAIRKLAEDFT